MFPDFLKAAAAAPSRRFYPPGLIINPISGTLVDFHNTEKKKKEK